MQLFHLSPPTPEQKNQQLKKAFTTYFAQRIRAVRKAKKLTQEEVAERSITNSSYVGHLEIGKYHPTLFVAWKLARALNITLDELLEGFSQDI